MKRFTKSQFKKLADHGKLHKVTGISVVGENLCESAVEFGVVNGYSLADICRFYAHRRGYQNSRRIKGWSQKQALQAGYDSFVRELAHFASSIFKVAPHLAQQFKVQTVVETGVLKAAEKPQS